MQNFYGYIRVSSVEQNESRQLITLEKFGLVRKNIYCDKVSGKNFNRVQYQQLRKRLKSGDVLVVTSLDRLGRNYEDVQNEWRYIVKEKKADIVILDMPILDTRTNKDLIGTLISDIVLQLLSYVAQTERENIRTRQAEGIAAARGRGVHLGRYADPLPESFHSVYEEYDQRRYSAQEAANHMGVTFNQFVWMVRKYRKKIKKDTEYKNRVNCESPIPAKCRKR